MQEPRRRRRLQFHLLPLAVACGPFVALAVACSAAPPPASVAAVVSPSASEVASPAPLAAPSVSASTSASPAPEPEPEPSSSAAPASAALPSGTKVLQIGDSFADALGKELGKLLRASGLRTALETKTPSYIGDWAYGPTLPKLLASFDPDLVLVTLGANELEVPEPARRVVPVQRLVKQLAGRPCVWILPPLWKADTGVMQVIKDNAGSCRVLDSSALVGSLPRGPDRIHPNAAGRARWASAVLDWLKHERDPAGSRPWSLLPGSP